MPRFSLPVALIAAAALAATASSAAAETGIEDPRYVACLHGMMSGYGSGLEETFCRGIYDLPSPFYFRCARSLRKGFVDERLRGACEAFFAKAEVEARGGYVRAAPMAAP